MYHITGNGSEFHINDIIPNNLLLGSFFFSLTSYR
uniref:Uncharacterized protein n=1 Tax=Anguilla anguilla TaxID=7936 RepID=A0A0E9WGI6_ANGAN